jgi:hypothetical protein
MTKEYLAEQKTKYQEKHDYFKKIGFDALAADFQRVVDLIKDMEKCVEKQTTQGD